jgi:hypothetical protein
MVRRGADRESFTLIYDARLTKDCRMTIMINDGVMFARE